jgi:ribosome-associated protein
VLREAKTNHLSILGSEGEDAAEWVLIDLADAVVHVMTPAMREYYELEKLWSTDEVPKVKKPRAKKAASAKKPAAKRSTAVTKKTVRKKAPAKKKAD